MTLKKYAADPREYSYSEAIQHLFAQLHPELDADDLRYVSEIVLDAVRDEIQERAEPKKQEDY